ncbi:MAG: gliding motility-associated ABC transporter substrate-binding protein GldG [Tenacibaculum sp.]|nr:gliding motility-associated ABC transporter substrate-binding protein GldG [Tenacibaculum sp.]
MNKKTRHIIIVLLGLIIINFIGNTFFKRLDLTADKRYTLSNVSQKLINKIDDTLLINIYLEGDFPSEFQRLQIETRQFLEELQAENSHIKFQFINPKNISKSLIKKGMIPSQLVVDEDGKLSNTIIFPWAEVSYKNKTEIISLLSNSTTASQEEQLQSSIEKLEFSFANAVNNITLKNKPKIAVLSGNGELEDIYLYSFLSEVSKKYHLAKFTLDSVSTKPQKTLKELKKYDLAIIAKPTEKFNSKEKLTIDQFIINGGKSLWMIDNVQADTDSLYNNGKMLAYPRDLNLTDLLFSYGIRINNKLIQDLYSAKIPLATGNIGNQPQFKNLNWFFHPLVNGNPKHPITKNILPTRLRFSTQIDTLKNNIKKTPLLISSVLTKKVGTPNFIELQSISKTPRQEDFKSGNQLFAVLLEGNFTSAYANRIKPFETKNFTEKSDFNKMIVIADGDIAKNQILKNEPYDLSVDKWTKQRFGNKDFLLNSIDYLLDDSGLINLRNKTITLNILNKQKAYTEKTFWQILNIIFPLTIVGLFGFIFNYYRKKKYN